MIGWLQRSLPTWQGRVTTGVALVAAVTAGLWPDHAREPDGGKITAVAVAAIAWLFAALAGAGKPREHDVKLFETFRTALKERDRRFLADQDFHNSFPAKGFEGLNDIAHWEGVAFEFVDARMQARWALVHAKVTAFIQLLAMNTGPVGGNVAMFTAHPTQGDPENPAEWTQKAIDQLNADATALHAQLEAFERYGRQRLGA